MKLPNLIRGITGTAVVWGVGFLVLGVPSLVSLMRPDAPPFHWSNLPGLFVPLVVYPFVHGAICGGLFGLLVAATSRRVNSVRQLSVARFAAIGAAAGVAMPFLVNGGHIALFEAAIAGILGVTTATASLLIARQSNSPMIDPSPEIARLDAVTSVDT